MQRLRSAMLPGNPEMTVGVRFWALWIAVQAALLAAVTYALPPIRNETPILVTVGYSLVIGLSQTLMLWPLAAAPRRIAVVAGLAVVYFMLTPAIYQVLVFSAFVVGMGLSPPGSPILDLFLVALSAGGGLLAGAVTYWALSSRWNGAARLLWLHTALAMLVTVTLDVVLVDLLGWRPGISQEVVIARTLAGGALGLVVAAATAVALRRLTLRTDTTLAADSLPDGYQPIGAVGRPAAAAEPDQAAPAGHQIAEPVTGFEVTLWVAAHALALPLLNLLSSHLPLNPLYVILGYAPTVGVIQAVILRMQYDRRSSVWRSWLLPTMLLPASGAFAAVMVMVALAPIAGMLGAPPLIGRGPAGFPIIRLSPGLYLPALGAGLVVGLLHWRRLRRLSRGPGWSALYVLANAVAPLLMVGVAAAVIWPTVDPRMSFELALDRTTVYTMLGACVAGVAVALLVGWATLLLVRHTNEP